MLGAGTPPAPNRLKSTCLARGQRDQQAVRECLCDPLSFLADTLSLLAVKAYWMAISNDIR